MGRQWASGLSLLFSDFRLFSTSAAHGCSGSPSFMLAPILKNVASGGPSDGGGGGGGRGAWAGAWGCAPPRPPGTRVTSHTPEKSGFPSAVRGVGAVRSGFPSAVFGTPEGYKGHCAKASGAAALIVATSTTEPIQAFIFRPSPRSTGYPTLLTRGFANHW